MQTSNRTKPVEVVIGGKVYRLAGNESEEYIQSLAHYVNKKLVDLSRHSSAGIEFSENYPILLALNIADDFFKTRIDENHKSSQEEALKDLSDMSNQLVEKTRENQELAKTLAEKNAAIAKYTVAMKKGSEDFENFKKMIAARDEELKKLRSRLAVADSNVEALNKKIADGSIEIGELNKKIAAKNQELNSLSVKLSEKNTALNDLNKKSAERNKKLNDVNKERDDLAVKLKGANAALADANKKIESLESGKNNENKQLADQIDELTEINKQLGEALAACQQEYADFKNSIPTDSPIDLQNALDAVKAENRKLSGDNEQLAQELAQAKEEVKSFIESLR